MLVPFYTPQKLDLSYVADFAREMTEQAWKALAGMTAFSLETTSSPTMHLKQS